MKTLYRPNRKKGQEVRRRRKNRRPSPGSILMVAVPALLMPVIGLLCFYGGTLGSKWVKHKAVGSPLFRLEVVRVKGAFNLTDEQVVETAGVAPGESLLGADLPEIQKRLLRHPLIRSAGVLRKLPSEILIEIEERIPIAVVRSDRNLVVDRDGHVLSVAAKDATIALPCLVGVEVKESKVTPEGMEDLRAGLDLVKIIRSTGFPRMSEIDSIRVSNRSDAVIVPLQGRPLVHVGRVMMRERLNRWMLVAPDIASRRQAIEYIDLRAEGQVVAKPVPNPAREGEDEG